MHQSFRTLVYSLSILVLFSFVHPEKPLPNVVIIYGDNIGYGDVDAYGSEKIPTPDIDALANIGLKFPAGLS